MLEIDQVLPQNMHNKYGATLQKTTENSANHAQKMGPLRIIKRLSLKTVEKSWGPISKIT
jgi:hypothetical protein